MRVYIVFVLMWIWLACGVGGFLHWYTYEHGPVGPEKAILVAGAAMLGPFAWPVGWLIHGGAKPWREGCK